MTQTRRITSLLLGSAVVLASASATLAGSYRDPIVTPTVTPPVVHVPVAYNWNGGYFGGGLGYGSASFDNPNANFPDASGAAIHGLVGYNWQGNGRGVFGAELLLAASAFEGENECSVAPNVCSSELSNTAALRFRAGIANDRTLYFMTLGYASSATELSVDGRATETASTRVSGPTIGVGIEHAMNNGWNLRGDIEHYSYGEQDYDFPSGTYTADVDSNVFRISFVRRF